MKQIKYPSKLQYQIRDKRYKFGKKVDKSDKTTELHHAKLNTPMVTSSTSSTSSKVPTSQDAKLTHVHPTTIPTTLPTTREIQDNHDDDHDDHNGHDGHDGHDGNKRKRWETWIQTYTSYRCGWWKGTPIDSMMVNLKVVWVICLIVRLPAFLFWVIDTFYGASNMSSILQDAQKGSGG